MAHLFKHKSLKQALKDIEIAGFEEKKKILQKWRKAYENGELQKKTESQCEQAFNQSFFVELLGYTTFPNETYTLDPKGSTEASAQKPDAILGHFTSDKQRVSAVVEIKDANTPLDKSQKREGNMSPIQQAFKYKPQYKECAFVIATNFFEIRLHRDNQLDYEQFTLDSLCNEKDDWFELKKFWYLLNSKNFVAKTGQSKTEKLLTDIRIEQEQITKEFYKEYKMLRQELIKNIVEKNEEARKKENFFALAVEKAQKIIDRIVFICFCEDLELLPENKLQEVVFHTEKLGLTIPIWEILKSFFRAIDSGSEKMNIPDGYNGELFKEDQRLNSLKIDDAVCKKFVDLGKYDFAEDLSVNILGHIFEQSISDIEELKSIGDEEGKKSKTSKRKKDGIFYTPDYIVDYIVKNALGKYLEEQETAILEKHGLKAEIKDKNYAKRALTAYEEYKRVVQNVKVLDPACGSGAFLVKVFDYLLEENKRVGNILADLRGGKMEIFETAEHYKEILQNNIYGVDLNPESVEITKLSLWLKTAQKGKKLANLSGNIKCGNSLIDDESVAGERAFKWEEEFPSICHSELDSESRGFDVVVGNPPYVSSKNENISEDHKKHMNEKYKTAQYQIDTYILFLEKGIELIKEKGKLGFIIPNAWMNNLFLAEVRKFLLENISFDEIAIMPSGVFEDATVDTVIVEVSKEIKKKNEIAITKTEGENIVLLHPIPQDQFLDNENYLFDLYVSPEVLKIIQKVEDEVSSMEEVCEITRGVNPYDKYRGQSEEIIKNRAYHSDHKKDETFVPELTGRNLSSWIMTWDRKHWISYGEWLAASREPKFFEGKRLLLRKIPAKNRLVATFIEDQFVTDQSVYIALSKNKYFELKYVLSILNSALMGFYFKYKNSEFDDVFPQIKVEHFRSLPIKNIPLSAQAPFIEKADLMLTLHKTLHDKKTKFLNLLQTRYELDKISRKLQTFWELDFSEFKKQLKLKKLALKEEEELLDFFEEHKKELSEIQTEIDKQDRIIDDMVFDLYGLSEEEREVVLVG